MDTTGSRSRRIVVGFDGSDPSVAALNAAMDFVDGRGEQMDVIYVSHIPGSASWSAGAAVGIVESLNAVADQLRDSANALIGQRVAHWHFHHRTGQVAHELVAAASELSRSGGPGTSVVIAVGTSSHRYHQVLGSVPVALARTGAFPLLVVPMTVAGHSPDLHSGLPAGAVRVTTRTSGAMLIG